MKIYVLFKNIISFLQEKFENILKCQNINSVPLCINASTINMGCCARVRERKHEFLNFISLIILIPKWRAKGTTTKRTRAWKRAQREETKKNISANKYNDQNTIQARFYRVDPF